ncbi:hypothetical protein AAOE16_02310 [Ekhidna sp. MALMAid0563]|uniref:hypothetical protein n=1 Tax=Ekhidna sp. MALMAid0563 TaxID=3143937 RepID=UPI0032DF75F9
MKTKVQMGIWIDLNEAILATGAEIIEVVNSEFTIGHTKGGSGSATPYGPQDARSESKVLEKRKHAIKSYFADILDSIEHCKEVLILGPGLVKSKLAEAIQEALKTRHIEVHLESSDKMTLNQLRAKVREKFKNE